MKNTNHQPPTTSPGGEAASVFQPGRVVRGRKQYDCCECATRIFEGDEHELFSGKFKAEGDDKDEADHDGRVWKTFRTCIRCMLARRRVKELTPSNEHPRRGELATAIVKFMAIPINGAIRPTAIIMKFTNTYRIDKQ